MKVVLLFRPESKVNFFKTHLPRPLILSLIKGLSIDLPKNRLFIQIFCRFIMNFAEIQQLISPKLQHKKSQNKLKIYCLDIIFSYLQIRALFIGSLYWFLSFFLIYLKLGSPKTFNIKKNIFSDIRKTFLQNKQEILHIWTFDKTFLPLRVLICSYFTVTQSNFESELSFPLNSTWRH